MKVKIKKEGKVKQFKLINKWEDVTLEKWIKLIHAKDASQCKEALKLIDTLTDIPKGLVKQLGLKQVVIILNQLSGLQKEQESYLKNIITVNGKEYGFHPDLDELTIGEYADMETLFKNDIYKHLPDLMAILYRPITEKGENGVYTIAAYDGNTKIRREEFKQMKAIMVQGALVFFYNLGKESLKILPSSLMQQLKEMNQL
jgi:hypothetical protein|tara:strand:- start:201 stop:803 length:603 start_codon:yes stop_codon:yes gene_type:complete